MKTLVLGLGNELLGDDGVGILAARRLKNRLDGSIDVVESELSGLALLEHFIGYERAIVLDAIHTTRYTPGTVVELGPDDFDTILAPSPHYSGLPELLNLARQLDLEFPKKIRIFAVEILDPYTIGESMSAPVKEGIEELIHRVEAQLRSWQEE